MNFLTDRDPEDETPVAHPESGLCEACHEDAALPDDDYCGACVLEIEAALAELEDDAA